MCLPFSSQTGPSLATAGVGLVDAVVGLHPSCLYAMCWCAVLCRCDGVVGASCGSC